MTKYIPLDEVINITESSIYPSDDEIRIRNRICNLPTLDPFSIIDEMIEELQVHKTPIAGALAEGIILALSELKQRLQYNQ